MFDLSRAFDTIHHGILVDKLEAYGIRGNCRNWLYSYLSNRSQKVVIKHNNNISYSEPQAIKTGVPQGSNLGPLLFILFINDIIENLGNYPTLFADDTSVSISANNLSELSLKLNDCVYNMQKYCLDNGLVLNNSKSAFIQFCTKELEQSLLLKINGKSVKVSSEEKFLGVFIDPKLTWHTHIGVISNKLASCCYVIRNLRRTVNTGILKTYYFGCVQSILNYGIICWGNSTHINEILLLQKRIIRLLSFANYRDSCRPLFKSHKILTVISLYIYNCLIYVRKNINMFTKVGDITHHFLRNPDKLTIPKHKSSLFAKGPNVMPVKLYNHLPTYVKACSTLPCFKRTVKSLLLEHSFYSIHEYLSSDLS